MSGSVLLIYVCFILLCLPTQAKSYYLWGCEFGQGSEWNFNQALDWYTLDYPQHNGLKSLVKDLNKIYTSHPALFQHDFEHEGFEWIDCQDVSNSIISYRPEKLQKRS